jgi:hypothetical protein
VLGQAKQEEKIRAGTRYGIVAKKMAEREAERSIAGTSVLTAIPH